MKPEPVLVVDDLWVGFQQRDGTIVEAVKGASFSIARGERFGLIGESGSGKTTTILAIMGLLPPNAVVSGRIELEGEELLGLGERGLRARRWSRMAMVFQGSMNAFSPVKRIDSQIDEALRLKTDLDRRARAQRVGNLLEMAGIASNRSDAFPHELSGGMRQRACIAMALACNPPLLLADEPTTALDVIIQSQILDLLVRVSDEHDVALVLVTHDIPLVSTACARAAVMRDGIIVEQAPVDDLYHAARHAYTRELFAAVPSLPALARPSAGDLASA